MSNEDNNQKIEGSGTTTKKANTALNKERSALVKRLKDGDVSTKLNVVRADYEVQYTIKASKKADHSVKSITIGNSEGWRVLQEQAVRKLTTLAAYDAKCNVQEFINLTDSQKEALNPRKKTTPAGYEPETTSFDGFLQRL